MKHFLFRFLLFIISIITAYLLWVAVILYFDYPAYIIPSPDEVYHKLVFLFETGKIYPHLSTTLTEITLGFIIGFGFAVGLGYLLAKIEWLKFTMTPYLVAFQSIPVVALAPLFILWFGTGITSKIAICSLIVFFPVMVNTVAAITNINKDQKALLKTLNASPWQLLTKLEIPAALPYLFSSIKIGFVLSIVGAIVGEFIGADQGLGFMINTSLGLFDTPQLFAIISILAMIGMLSYSIPSIFEYVLIDRKYRR